MYYYNESQKWFSSTITKLNEKHEYDYVWSTVELKIWVEIQKSQYFCSDGRRLVTLQQRSKSKVLFRALFLEFAYMRGYTVVNVLKKIITDASQERWPIYYLKHFLRNSV